MLTEIKNKKEWNELVSKTPQKSGAFLQSWQWGEFQKAVGRTVLRFTCPLPRGERTENSGGGDCQIIEHALPFRQKYWLIPRSSVTAEIEKEARRHCAIFIRCEPSSETAVPKNAHHTIHVSPPTTLIVDLGKSEDELLAAMHEKTRYNIRLATRKGVRCQMSDVRCFNVFWKLMEETARRDGFRTHPCEYYKKMLEISPSMEGENEKPRGGGQCYTKLWIAEWEGKPLAAGIWIYFGDTVTYLHGASSSEHREVMAPHLLHWEVMRDAKARGYRAYDFWGISSSDKAIKRLSGEDAWAGITRFKKGFGGEVIEYPGTYDLPISPLGYTLYKIARTMRR